MNIQTMLIPINPFSRPGYKLKELKGFVFHYMGDPQATAKNCADYFAKLSKQNLNDDIVDRYASTHYAIGLNGEITQMIPENEVAYHVGANTYTPFAAKELGENFVKNKTGQTPNFCLLGCELAHLDVNGRYSWEVVRSAIKLAVYICKKYSLNPITQIYRHYDITGKICPRFWVDNPDDWDYFKQLVVKELKNEKVLV